MKQEVIQDFLNLPGIEGLALMDGRSRPYFCGVDQGLNLQQKQALVQGIQQVLETTPTAYQCFQFQFGTHQVYVHKLAYGLILLVMTSVELQYRTYQRALAPLAELLQHNPTRAIANVRSAAGNTNVELSTHSSLSQSSSASVPPSTSRLLRHSAASDPMEIDPPLSSGSIPPSTQHHPPLTQSSEAPPRQTCQPAKESTVNPEVTIDEFLNAINDFLHLATEYLGHMMIANYWKSSRPPIQWLNTFNFDSSDHRIMIQHERVQGNQPLNPQQQQWLREWVAAFLQKCDRIIRDFSNIALHLDLDPRQKTLLFSTP